MDTKTDYVVIQESCEAGPPFTKAVLIFPRRPYSSRGPTVLFITTVSTKLPEQAPDLEAFRFLDQKCSFQFRRSNTVVTDEDV